MSIEVANGEKSLGQFASNQGYSDLIRAIVAARRSHPGKFNALRQFVHDGKTNRVPEAVKDLRALAPGLQSDIRSTALGLAQLIDGQDTAIITDGLG